MNKIMKWKQFRESLDVNLSNDILDLNESLSILNEIVMKSVGGEEIDIYKEFNLPFEEYNKMNIDELFNSSKFINSLSSIGLKKSNIQNTDDYETFLKRPMKFGMIYKIEANELENPDYVAFQSWNISSDSWERIKTFRVSVDIKNFYDKLSSKLIELEKDGSKYIYSTSNGNEWILQNKEKENNKFKSYFRKEELEDFISSQKILVNMI